MPRTESQDPPTRADSRGEVIGRYKAKIKDAVVRLRTTAAENAKLKQDLAKAQQAADEAPLKKENDELRHQVRTGKHRQVFDRLARAAGAPDEALDDLWSLSGYKADKDAVDEAKVSEAIEAQKAHPARKRLFESGGQADDEAETEEATEKPTRTPPGGGRGGSSSQAAAKGPRLTPAQLADHKFMLNPKNKEYIKNAKVRLPDREGQ